MKALQALDHLRQRTAWALPQIFVSSSTIDFIETKQRLHFYDIFVQNTFSSYLQVMRKVTFSPVISNWQKENWENIIDPRDMWHTLQDRYPIVDLQGRHCGDLHPLGSETNSTYHGAGYVFVGVANVSLTLE